MRKILLLLSVAFLSVSSSLFAEPENLHNVIVKLEKYHDDGAYSLEIKHAVFAAKNYLQSRFDSACSGHKCAIMLDIDETSLSNYPAIIAWLHGVSNVGDTLTAKQLEQLTHPFNDKPIKPVLGLYNYAKDHNVRVFFVTGRTENDRAGTIANLKSAGYNRGWAGLFLRQPSQAKMSAAEYKSSMAAKISADYNLVMAVGDQKSDLPSQAGKGFKIPNPYYFIA
jgi:predicted secreted acid phosphatase